MHPHADRRNHITGKHPPPSRATSGPPRGQGLQPGAVGAGPSRRTADTNQADLDPTAQLCRRSEPINSKAGVTEEMIRLATRP
jgi:hypothetical protein